jgi:glycosyltransferase involved in cell wall biosynthesis
MRILFVAPGTSLHTVRWMNQMAGLGWDLHMFPVEPYPLQPLLRDVTLHHVLFRRRPLDDHDIARLDKLGLPVSARRDPGNRVLPQGRFDRSVRQRGLVWPFRSGAMALEDGLARNFPRRFGRAARLAQVIRRLRPDVVHSLEIIGPGALTLAAHQLAGSGFPPWIVTNNGDDLYLHGKLAATGPAVRGVLAACDYYRAECQRDIALARELGFRGESLPVLPNAGGLDLDRAASLRQPGPTSARRLIVVKGYQDWAGRALVALQALERLADRLDGYRIALFLAPRPVRIAAELMSRRTGIPIDVVPWSEHEEILRLHGQARLSIGVSISDGIPSSLLEAMAMGSFPIQSDTSCACEWIVDGQTGALLSSQEPLEVAAAIAPALTDDALVDDAARRNAEVARKRLDQRIIRPQVAEMYRKVAQREPVIS